MDADLNIEMVFHFSSVALDIGSLACAACTGKTVEDRLSEVKGSKRWALVLDVYAVRSPCALGCHIVTMGNLLAPLLPF